MQSVLWQLWISLSYLTGKHATSHLPLNAQEAYYVTVFTPHTGHDNGVWQSYESYYRLIIQLSVQLHMNSINQAAIVRQTPQTQTTGCGKKHLQCLLRKMNMAAEGELREPPTSLWLLVAECLGPCESQESCQGQLNGVLSHPAETPSCEQKCDRSTLNWETEAAGRHMQPFVWWFNFSLLEITSLILCVHLRPSPVICWLFNEIYNCRDAPW